MKWEITNQKFIGVKTLKGIDRPSKPGKGGINTMSDEGTTLKSTCHCSSHLLHFSYTKPRRKPQREGTLIAGHNQKEQGATDSHNHPMEEIKFRAPPPARSQNTVY